LLPPPLLHSAGPERRAASPDARRVARFIGGATLAVLLADAAPAFAQGAAEKEFSVQRFDPAPGPRNYFSTRGVRTSGEMAWSAGLFVNYAYRPFAVKSCFSESNCDDPNATGHSDVKVIDNLLTGDALASLTPIPRLQIGLKVPVSWVSGDGLSDTGVAAKEGIDAVGMGDVTLEGKYRLHGEIKDPFVVGAGAFVTGPLGRATAKDTYIGDASPTAGIRGIFDGEQGPFSFGGNLSAVYRGEGRVGSTTLGPEFRYGVAGGFKPSPVLRVVLDGFGATKFSAKNGTNTLEVDGGIQIMPIDSPIVISAGAGTGLIQGVGVPVVRGFLGFMFVAEGGDRDGDGVKDGDDQCPTIAGSPETNGCPAGARDSDGDTIPDDADKCPKVPEDPDGFQDQDGCPELDNDNDGVPDDQDRCPDKPETKNGYKDDDGCPDEPDRDNDGVPDKLDKCPDAPEDTDGFEDTDGCPDPDNDQDGVPDQQDECGDQPETKNGYQDEDGCPDEVPTDDKKKDKKKK
jgi:hypothetical protein